MKIDKIELADSSTFVGNLADGKKLKCVLKTIPPYPFNGGSDKMSIMVEDKEYKTVDIHLPDHSTSALFKQVKSVLEGLGFIF